MGHGGRRLGAGRKPGGVTQKTREIADGAAADGKTPLSYMICVMNDETAAVERRDDMAKAAAQFCHPRLAAHVVSTDGDRSRPAAMKIEFVLPQGYRVDERGQVIEHEALGIDRESESETEH